MPEQSQTHSQKGRPHPLVSTGPGGNLDLDSIFTYHAPFGDQTLRYEEIRSYGRDLAVVIATDCPPSPERSTALAKVREAVMWANAAIACNEKDPAKRCTCRYGFVQAEGQDPHCPKHGTPVVHWMENGAMIHAVPDVTNARGTMNPFEVQGCDICLQHLKDDPMPGF